jgi:hypothetical protein
MGDAGNRRFDHWMWRRRGRRFNHRNYRDHRKFCYFRERDERDYHDADHRVSRRFCWDDPYRSGISAAEHDFLRVGQHCGPI